jgi:hypothetical protein
MNEMAIKMDANAVNNTVTLTLNGNHINKEKKHHKSRIKSHSICNALTTSTKDVGQSSRSRMGAPAYD